MNVSNKHNITNLFQELNIIKQELIQAENKIGWASTFFTIIISVSIAIGIKTNHWLIIGPIVAFPILSLSILVIALIPSIKLFPYKKINLYDRINIIKISIFEYENVYKKTNLEESLIKSVNLFSKLSFKKYKLIKIAFWITFFWIIIFKMIFHLGERIFKKSICLVDFD